MYKPIIVSLDGSAYSEEVLPYAKQIAQATGAEVQLNRVVDSAKEIASASNYLRKIAGTLGEHVDINVHQGDVAAAINKQIKAEPNSLAVLATHGRTGLREVVLGSTALAIVRGAGKPVLVYRPRGSKKATGEVSSIAVALDGTSFPEAILPNAIQLALDLNAKLTLLQVISPVASVPGSDVLESSYLMSTAHDIASKHRLDVDWEVLHGNPSEAICDFVHGKKDLILAVTSHARPALERVIFGSVAAGCVRNAGVPILVYWQ